MEAPWWARVWSPGASRPRAVARGTKCETNGGTVVGARVVARGIASPGCRPGLATIAFPGLSPGASKLCGDMGNSVLALTH
jgi:hypothetical protein